MNYKVKRNYGDIHTLCGFGRKMAVLPLLSAAENNITDEINESDDSQPSTQSLWPMT